MAMHGTLLHQYRGSIHLYCLLIARCVASSSLPSSVSCKVGNEAVLPCSWKSHNRVNKVPVSHIQWQTPDHTVFEQQGVQRWQASEFEGRVEVPEDKMEEGDCSLIVRDVQFGDVGLYESFALVVVDGARMKRRKIFLQSVQLAVHDHKSKLSLGVGEDLVLALHTPRAVRVVTQAGNSSDWAELWMKGEESGRRLEDGPGGRLVLRDVTAEDAGTYKVLDSHGLAVSTVQLSVGAVPAKLPRVQDKQAELVGRGTINIPSSLLIAALCLLLNPIILI